MCLIAVQKAGDVMFSRQEMRNSWENNSDGAGYMYVVDGRVVIRKPFFTFRDLRRAYAGDFQKHGKDSPFVVHYRWTTHGLEDKCNTHPHRVPTAEGGSIGMVHNGVITIESDDQTKSDTVMFARKCLASKPEIVLMSGTYAKLVGEAITSSNKLVLLAGDKRISIINENVGHWKGSRWYSNYGYTPNVMKYMQYPLNAYTPTKHYPIYSARESSRVGRSDEWDTINDDGYPESIPFRADDRALNEQADNDRHYQSWCDWAESRGYLLVDAPTCTIEELSLRGEAALEKMLRQGGYLA